MDGEHAHSRTFQTLISYALFEQEKDEQINRLLQDLESERRESAKHYKELTLKAKEERERYNHRETEKNVERRREQWVLRRQEAAARIHSCKQYVSKYKCGCGCNVYMWVWVWGWAWVWV